MDAGFEMDDFDHRWNEADEDDFMPYPSNAPRRYQEAYGDYQGGYGPRGGVPPPPPLLGFNRIPPLMPPMGPPPGMGRGFGPGGPGKMRGGEERAKQYLIKCGLTREAVRLIPSDVLFRMEPQRCGLCCIEFNSFPLSRIHYMSKGHATALKKWINNKPNRAASKKMETPIKSRELYCELCDVQITSKVHGDSHYAGKAHLGVVEGRKQPKNPLLLIPSAKKRLEQLIRREKKAMSKKPDDGVEEAAAADQSVKAPAKEAKPINPKYYCKICKTAVTCSEQMTMHMNGKKHLTKEKQHILRMMRGEPEEPEEVEGEGGDKPEAGGEEGAQANEGEEVKEETGNETTDQEWNETWEDGPGTEEQQ